jgi:hypothetical protein
VHVLAGPTQFCLSPALPMKVGKAWWCNDGGGRKIAAFAGAVRALTVCLSICLPVCLPETLRADTLGSGRRAGDAGAASGRRENGLRREELDPFCHLRFLLASWRIGSEEIAKVD